MLKTITHSPYLNLLSGLILLMTAGYETLETLDHFQLGSHHGVLMFSVIQIVKTVPEFMHGLKEVEESEDVAKQ